MQKREGCCFVLFFLNIDIQLVSAFSVPFSYLWDLCKDAFLLLVVWVFGKRFVASPVNGFI